MKGFQFPLIDKNTVWNKLNNKVLEKEGSYENLWMSNSNLVESNMKNVKIDCGILNHVNLRQSQMEKIKLSDVKITESNLSNIDAFESFWLRVEIDESKLTGLKLNSAIMEDVYIKDSNSQFIQLRFGKAKRVIFESCNMKGSDFTNTDLTGCKFLNCDLSEAEFSGSILTGTDLRGSNLEKIKIGVKEIKGAIVNTNQALFLSGLLGIDIRD